MNRLGRFLTAAVFAGLTLASMAGFMRIFAPRPRPPKAVPFEAYDRDAMQQALQPATVAAEIKAITGASPRERRAIAVQQQPDARDVGLEAV